VLMFDLDHFKGINDRFGHSVGDRALQVFAETASMKLRATDIIGRLGGEEFAAVLPATSLVSAGVAAERVRCAFEAAAVEIDGLPVKGTVSIGAAAATNPNSDIDALLVQADKALYAAKAGGRNRVALSASTEKVASRPAEEKGNPTAAGEERNDPRPLADIKELFPSPGIAPADLPLTIATARSRIKPAA